MLPEIKADISEDSQRFLIRGAAKILEPFGIGAAMLSDQLAYYRLKCLVEIVEKAKDLLEDHGYNPTPISHKFLARFVEEASYEDDPDLQDMWAYLLGSASTGEEQILYINILKNMDKFSANLLKEIYSHVKSNNSRRYRDTACKYEGFSRVGGAGVNFEGIKSADWCMLISAPEESGVPHDEGQKRFVAAQNLQSMQLIELNSQVDMRVGEVSGAVVWATTNLFGYNFIEACIGEIQNDNNQ